MKGYTLIVNNMPIYAIAATGFNGELGLRGTIPWQGKLPRDMKYFMQTTKNSVIIMGRITADSLKLPLATRKAIIITTKKNETLERYGEHSFVVGSLDEAITLYKNLLIETGHETYGPLIEPDTNAFIIGGAQIYRQAMEMDIIDRMYLTTVHGNFNADASFLFDRTYYNLISSEVHPPDDKNVYGCTFDVYERQPR